MPKTTDNDAETTESKSYYDVLGNVLESMRITGSLLIDEAYALPWGVAIPANDALAKLLGVSKQVRVVAFHLVKFGHCELTVADSDPQVLTAGEMAICFGGAAHQLSQGSNPRCLPVTQFLNGGENPYSPETTARPPATALLCGVFMLQDTELNPLFAALPPVLRTTVTRVGELHNLAGVARLITDELTRHSFGGGYIVSRLLEVLCAEAIRSYIETGAQHDVGWCSGVKDTSVGRAIAAVHAQPGENWSVQRMAQLVAMSPSRFAARFSAALGESPMAYIAKWRMNVACRRLTNSQQSINQIANDLGYINLTAFNRAFKKLLGMPPAAWRKHRRGDSVISM